MVQPKEKTENEENHKGKVSGMDAAMAHRERKQLHFSTIVDFPSQNRVSFLSHSDMLKATFKSTLNVAFIFALYSVSPML